MKQKITSNTGFSLIELMVALVVSLIILTAIYGFFTYQLGAFSSQQQVVKTQVNSKAFVRYLKEVIENAGTGIPSNIANTSPINHANAVNDANDYYLKGSDILQVIRGGYSTVSFEYDSLSGNSLNFSSTPQIPFDLSAGDDRYKGDLLILQDSSSNLTALCNITAVNTNSITFVAIDSTWSPKFVNSDISALGTSGVAYLIPQDTDSIQTFFVEDSDQDGVGTLRVVNGYFNINNLGDTTNRNALPILTNVEDFQVDFLLDGNGDGFADIGQAQLVDPAFWNDNPGNNITEAQVVRIRLLVRSQREDRNITVDRPNLTGDGPHNFYNYTTDQMKRFRRRMYTITAELRNK
jgi:prepilin-type N-terminal cleavage/methylation domain-containing protein